MTTVIVMQLDLYRPSHVESKVMVLLADSNSAYWPAMCTIKIASLLASSK